MKSSMTFIQSNGSTEIDLILKQKWRRFIWRQVSFKQGYLAERLKSSFRKFNGRYGDLILQYEVSLSRMLNDILILDQQWLPNQSDFPPISWPWYRVWPSPIMTGFHIAFAMGVACQQGTLTLLDTWFRPPLWDLLVLQLCKPDSSNLPCLYSTFLLEYPLLLSRFSFLHIIHCDINDCQWDKITALATQRHRGNSGKWMFHGIQIPALAINLPGQE